jgi:hypothetical protein
VRGDEHGGVEHAVLLGADQLLAVQEQDGSVGGAGQPQGGHVAALAHLLDGDGLAGLGQREPARVGPLAGQQGGWR